MGGIQKRDLGGRLLSSRLLWSGLLTLGLAVFAFIQAGRYISGPVDVAAKADLILALGGDAGARIEKAYKLYAAGYAPRVLLTGIENGTNDARPNYLNWRAAFLIERGVSRDAIHYDLVSRNTWEEAVNTRRLMEKNGWRTVLVVSDPPHMRRLSWVWGKVFDGSPMRYRLLPVPMPEWDAKRWWGNEYSARYMLLELIKIGYYRVAY